MTYINNLPEIGTSISGRATTATLYVSPNGANTDGSTWANAYNTIQAALDAASTDADDCTLIMIAPHTTFYDIDTTGDPTWTGNYEIKGTHRIWAAIKNTHASATSVFKFTGKVSLTDAAIFTGGSTNGVIFTNSGYRIRHCGFNSEGTTGANTAIHIDGSAGFIRGGIIQDIELIGNVAYTTGLYMNNAKINSCCDSNLNHCLNAVQVVHVDSDGNAFTHLDIGDCNIAFNLDAGNGQHLHNIDFHDNTTNIDDEVGDHDLTNLSGHFNMASYPDDLTGVDVAANATADLWGTDTEVRSAATATKPFRIIGYNFEPAVSQKHQVRFSADGGSTYFDEVMVEQTKGTSSGASGGTEFIFNAGTQIMASVMAETGGSDVMTIWLKIQEI